VAVLRSLATIYSYLTQSPPINVSHACWTVTAKVCFTSRSALTAVHSMHAFASHGQLHLWYPALQPCVVSLSLCV
jgi:hypothetical protein